MNSLVSKYGFQEQLLYCEFCLNLYHFGCGCNAVIECLLRIHKYLAFLRTRDERKVIFILFCFLETKIGLVKKRRG